MKTVRILVTLAVGIGAVVALALPVAGAEQSGSGIQGYAADAPIEIGTIVQLTGESADRVKPVGQEELPNMFGVVIDRNKLSLRLSSSELQNETFVAVSGVHAALVSTQGGPIAVGDHVTLSSIDGIAMKAGTEEATVFGRAMAGFDGKGVTLGTATLKDTTGAANKTVALGSIPVTIDIKRNPNEKTTKANVPEVLERVGQAIAEKEVSAIRIYLSLGITAVSIIAAIAIIYSGVKNSIISIGRNPMTKRSIFRALLEIIFTSLLILIIGLFAVYLLLKL